MFGRSVDQLQQLFGKLCG